jgi:hypothetical protein
MIPMKFRTIAFGALLVSATAGAQEEQSRRQGFPRDRDAMQQRFQQRFAEVVRDKVGLNDDQMSKLTELNRRFESKRRDIFMRDRDIRIGLRDELADGVTPNDERVKKLLDDQLRVQRERIDLMEAEQSELSQFMSPTQRARYFGIQEQMRRKVDELRGPPGGPDGPPPMEGEGRRHRMKKSIRDSTTR